MGSSIMKTVVLADSTRVSRGYLGCAWSRVCAAGVACMCAVSLVACGTPSADDEVSTASSGEVVQSGAMQSADFVMSGEYRVSPDGKLLSPLYGQEIEPPQRNWVSQKPGKEGAEEFARYVVELLPYTWMSQDTSELKEVSHEECIFCQDIIKKVESDVANGVWATGISYSIVSLGPAFEIPDYPGIWNVDLDLTRSAIAVYDGESLKTEGERHEEIRLQLQFINGAWKLWAGGKQ